MVGAGNDGNDGRTVQSAEALVSPPSYARLGEVLAGKYRIERVIGRGGMGIVVAASHIKLRQTVAIKFLLPSSLSEPELAKRLVREARAAAALKGEHVARVFDVDAVDGAPYIVMEYLEGQTLASLLETSGPLAPTLAVDYALEVCEALAEAHALGIVHRDLKPSNLFLARTPGGRQSLRVLDFGISKALDGERSEAALGVWRLAGSERDGSTHSGTDSHAFVGSPPYVSPEQLIRPREADGRSDIWSLGVVLYQCFSGRLPFHGETLTRLWDSILRAPMPAFGPTDSPGAPGLEKIVRRCLEKDPARRYGDVLELARELAPLASPRARVSLEVIEGLAVERASRAPRCALVWERKPAAPARCNVDGSADDARADAGHDPSDGPPRLVSIAPGGDWRGERRNRCGALLRASAGAARRARRSSGRRTVAAKRSGTGVACRNHRGTGSRSARAERRGNRRAFSVSECRGFECPKPDDSSRTPARRRSTRCRFFRTRTCAGRCAGACRGAPRKGSNLRGVRRRSGCCRDGPRFSRGFRVFGALLHAPRLRGAGALVLPAVPRARSLGSERRVRPGDARAEPTMSRAAAIRLGVALVLAAVASPACKADESALDAIFDCDPERGDAQCGTDENGKPMTCYVGSAQLGGEAFCTKACDPTVPTEPGYVCTSSGALLESCHPDDSDLGCPSPLNCYRTDIILNQGLCMWVPTCPYRSDGTLDDSQCGFMHEVCAGHLLRDLAKVPRSKAFCASTIFSALPSRRVILNGCPIDERCPTSLLRGGRGLPIVCGAPCDENSCPPNFACARGSGSGAPSVRLPGIPGIRCQSSEDCLTGACIDTGAGFSVCTQPAECTIDADCPSIRTNYADVCVEGIPGEGAYCISPIPFQGANCENNDQCSEELRCGAEPCPPRHCASYSPYELNPTHGECRFTCTQAEGCPAFGGLPHVCLEDDGGCYPGIFGMPCTSSTECYANLTCGAVAPDIRSRSQAPSICTVPCMDDDDCTFEVNPWLGGGGYCVPAPDPPSDAVGYCRSGANLDRPCDGPEHCWSRNCELQEDGSRRCAL